MIFPPRSIRRAGVIGAGTMGAGIAALLASAGLTVDLLDIVPQSLTSQEVEQGLDLSDPWVRDRVAREGWARARSSRPADAISAEAAERVSIGNLEEDLEALARADWIIEAVVEDLSVKRQVMASIEKIRAPECVVSTNTSGIPIRQIVEERSEAFAAHFLGTHFFNPPLTMKMIEVIPCPRTEPDVVESIRSFIEARLDKRVVLCKDTPNFIANRVASVQSCFDMDYVLTHGYTVEQADAILGPIVGRPKTAVFRLRDLVGLDVSTQVAENLYRAIPHDAYRDVLVRPRLSAMRSRMLERGFLGRKSGGGFYRVQPSADARTFQPIDLETLEYRDPQPVNMPTLSQAGQMENLADRLRFLVAQSDRVGELVWASLSNVMAYAAYCVPEISDRLPPVDLALRLGYSWQLGPFEMWDALGLPATLERMRREGLTIALWVDRMVKAGHLRFYETIDGELHAFSPVEERYRPVEQHT
jgi:3-hydroxyacyl-CoA dehydrogenase